MTQARSTLKLCRVWCGRKCWTGWLPGRAAAFEAAIDLGLAYKHPSDGSVGLGPLTWIEYGERRYARSRTVRVDPFAKGMNFADWR